MRNPIERYTLQVLENPKVRKLLADLYRQYDLPPEDPPNPRLQIQCQIDVTGWGKEIFKLDQYFRPISLEGTEVASKESEPDGSDITNYLVDMMILHQNDIQENHYFSVWDIDFNLKQNKGEYLLHLIYMGYIHFPRLTLSQILWEPENNTWDIWKKSKAWIKPCDCTSMQLKDESFLKPHEPRDTKKPLIEKDYCHLQGKSYCGTYAQTYRRDDIKMGFLNEKYVSINDIIEKVDRERALSLYKNRRGVNHS